jgi:hypothetical protein
MSHASAVQGLASAKALTLTGHRSESFSYFPNRFHRYCRRSPRVAPPRLTQDNDRSRSQLVFHSIKRNPSVEKSSGLGKAVPTIPLQSCAIPSWMWNSDFLGYLLLQGLSTERAIQLLRSELQPRSRARRRPSGWRLQFRPCDCWLVWHTTVRDRG